MQKTSLKSLFVSSVFVSMRTSWVARGPVVVALEVLWFLEWSSKDRPKSVLFVVCHKRCLFVLRVREAQDDASTLNL